MATENFIKIGLGNWLFPDGTKALSGYILTCYKYGSDFNYLPTATIDVETKPNQSYTTRIFYGIRHIILLQLYSLWNLWALSQYW